MLRLAVTLFFTLIFSVQILPVEEVAAFIYGARITEEIPHGQDGPQAKESENGSKFFFHHGMDRAPFDGTQSSLTAFLRILDEQISSRSADDVTTPPPNVGS